MPLPEGAGDRRPPGQPPGRGPSLGDALAWLDRHVNLELLERGGGAPLVLPDLRTMEALVSAMGDPQSGYPVIHLTGTNGKGSTTRMVAALLEAQGLVTGSYTSPHLERVNERIARNASPVPDEDLAEQLGALEKLEGFLLRSGGSAALPAPPTWFELLTAAAFRYFADQAVQAAVVEVGLGGRQDATNVVTAAVAVLTNVELDHLELLGPTRLDIARAKAGIVKTGSVVVMGEEDPELVEVVAEEGRRVGAEALWRRGVDFACDGNRLAHGGRMLDLRTPGAAYEELFLPLHGAHQGENAAVALAAAEAFFGAPLDPEVVAEAFAGLRLPGRLEVLARRPLVLLDGAHNPAGAQALGAALAEDFAGPGRLQVLFGCLRGPDPAELLESIGTERIARVVATPAPSPRTRPAGEVAAAAAGLGLAAVQVETLEEGLERCLAAAGEDDLVLVTGSLYLVGQARAVLRPRR